MSTVPEIIWYAVRVKPQQRTYPSQGKAEPAKAPFLIERQLQLRGFEVWMPRQTVYRFVNGTAVKRRKKIEVPRPILVGWIFVGWPRGENRWRVLFDTPGVVAVAGADGRPAPIRDGALRQFARRFGGGLLTAHERERFMRSRAEFSPGRDVRLLADPFAGFVGKVVSVKNRQARVLLNLLGSEREVVIDAMLVEAA